MRIREGIVVKIGGGLGTKFNELGVSMCCHQIKPKQIETGQLPDEEAYSSSSLWRGNQNVFFLGLG